MILAVTGHQPDKILIGNRNAYDPQIGRALVDFALAQLELARPDVVISGLAQGWEQAVVQAAAECGIPFVASVRSGKDAKWGDKSRKTYRWLLGQAIRRVEGGTREAIDAADGVLGLWAKPTPPILYAEQRGKQVTNVWAGWERWTTTRRAVQPDEAYYL